MTQGAWRYSAPVAIVLIVGFVLLMHGLARGPASVLVPVAQMSFVFTALLGVVDVRRNADHEKARRPRGRRRGAGLFCAWSENGFRIRHYALIFCTSASDTSKLA